MGDSKSTTGFTFGLQMIVRDSAHLLPRIFDVLLRTPDVFDEIVVVDTGSRDSTIETLENYAFLGLPVKVGRFEWNDSFSDARNYALSLCTTDCAMWLDSDDTFTEESCLAWRKVAECVFSADEPSAHAVLPYHYHSDSGGNVLLLQYRERIIKNPQNWEWREPIHEVLCWRAGESEEQPAGGTIVLHCPVVHKPELDRGNPDRNFAILRKMVAEGTDSVRNSYYYMRELICRKNYDAVVLMRDCLDSAYGHYRYEMLTYCAIAYGAISEGLSETAVDYYEQAIAMTPSRNEARVQLWQYLMDHQEFERALTVASGMGYTPPNTIALVDMDLYHHSVYAFKAKTYWELGEHAYAIEYLIMALDCPRPHALALELRSAAVQWLRTMDYCMIYADPAHTDAAMTAREVLNKLGVVGGAFISTNPLCGEFAHRYYLHFTSAPSTLYMIDRPVGVRTMLFHTHTCVLDGGCLGFSDVEVSEMTTEDVSLTLQLLLAPQHSDLWLDWSGYSLEQVQEILMEESGYGIAEKRSVFIGEPYIIDNHRLYEGNLQSRHHMIVYVGADGNNHNKLLGVQMSGAMALECNFATECAEHTEDLREVVYVFSGNIEVRHVFEGEFEGFPPVGRPFDVRTVGMQYTPSSIPHVGTQTETPLRKIGFVAPGIEEWDGTTPWHTGIGASETCLINYAEELARAGNRVTVYCPIPVNELRRVVRGVEYKHISDAQNARNFDIFVVSRIPQFTEIRRGKVQCFWMHDLPAVYDWRALGKEPIVDKFLCVSEWEKHEALVGGYPEEKLFVLPNTVNKAFADPALTTLDARHTDEKRLVWLAQPERGLPKLVKLIRNYLGVPDVYQGTDMEPVVQKERITLSVAYGFENYLRYHRDNMDKLRSVYQMRFELRSIGARILGRLNRNDMRELMGYVDLYPYISDFPETFCVSALEAVISGVNVVPTRVGAICDTLEISKDTPIFQTGDGSETMLYNVGVFQTAVKEAKRRGHQWRGAHEMDNWNSVFGGQR